MPFIALLIIAALVYWLWPLFLVIAASGSMFFLFRQHAQDQNIEKAKKALPSIRDNYVGRYGMQEADLLKCLRIEDATIGGPKGNKLILSASLIYWDDRESDEYPYKFKSEPCSWTLTSIDAKGGRETYSQDALLGDIDNFFRHASITIFDKDSLESEVCALMFLNLPEAQWASSAIVEINSALGPVEAAYNASLTNELMSGNSEYLSQAAKQLQAEINKLSAYAEEACQAMKKIYEFLSIPKSLKQFNSLDTSPLEVYAKQQQMREEFNSAIAIKNEYDRLRR